MSTASMMAPPGNEIEGTLSKPIAFQRARGSPIAPSKFGRSSVANIHANSAIYDTKRLSIMKAAKFNYSLLTEFDEQDRRIAATMIQITYRGFCDRHLVMEMVSDQLESKRATQNSDVVIIMFLTMYIFLLCSLELPSGRDTRKERSHCQLQRSIPILEERLGRS